MDEVDLRRVAGEKIRFLACGVTAADYRHDLLLEERRVADRAVRNPFASILEFTRNSQLDRSSAGRHDDGGRSEYLPVLAFGMEVAVFHFSDRIDARRLEEFGAELFGVRREFFGELVTEDFRKTDDVVEIFGVEKLATGEPSLQDRGR